ncbi:MAG: MerR family transcriptional regulator [Terasakiella sp.]|uniref:MerR family transcriptional regulator n=1 Tax=Terasakiella brassicae TaxID=1634917 RepID=A0A917BSU3_9PROT|nr:MerR family DNA-binding transcriptional regulator [Terasakiella brassicae]GGF55486.1 MerR family transcriptional regulator [Terasakiella brassicae]
MVGDEFYTVPELAKELGITPRAIRFYETKELLSPQRAGTTRVYTRKDRARLILILRGKRLGFSLAEIREFLDLYETDVDHVEQILMLRKKVRHRIDDLEEQRIELESVLVELKDIESQCDEALQEKEGI